MFLDLNSLVFLFLTSSFCVRGYTGKRVCEFRVFKSQDGRKTPGWLLLLRLEWKGFSLEEGGFIGKERRTVSW
jgi:hypothetical protein